MNNEQVAELADQLLVAQNALRAKNAAEVRCNKQPHIHTYINKITSSFESYTIHAETYKCMYMHTYMHTHTTSQSYIHDYNPILSVEVA